MLFDKFSFMRILIFLIFLTMPILAKAKDIQTELNAARAFAAFQCMTFAAIAGENAEVDRLSEIGLKLGREFVKENPKNDTEFISGVLVGTMLSDAGWVSRKLIREQSEKSGEPMKKEALNEFMKRNCDLLKEDIQSP